MKKCLLIALLVALFSFPARADKNDKIKELVSLMNYDKLITETVDQQLFSKFECIFVIPETERNTIRQQLIKAMNLQKLLDAMIDYLSQNLNEQELEDLLAFYKTAGGQKLLMLQTDMAQFFSKEFADWMKEMAPQMDQFATDMEMKYSQRPRGEAQKCMMAKQK